MMKRTQFLDARRNIRKEIVAHVSIVMIGLLASLAYLSIAYSAATLKKDAVEFFNSHGMWDLEITSTMLMDEEDLEAIRAVPGVEETERVYQLDTRIHTAEESGNVTVMSLPEAISVPVLCEGRLPERAGECAAEKELMEELGLSLGQRIEVESAQISGLNILRENSFVISGMIQTPDHITYMIPVTPYLLVSEESFNLEELDGAFMKARIRVKDAPDNRYSSEYWESVSLVSKDLEALGTERAPLRHEKLRRDYEQQILDGEAQLEKGAEELRLARAKIEEGKRELEAAAEQLGLGKDLLDYGELQLNEAREKIDAGAAKLEEAVKMLKYARSILARGKEWILDNITEENWPSDIGVSYAEFREVLERGEEAAIDWINELAKRGRDAFSNVQSQWEEARNNWYYMGEQYLDGVTSFEKGVKQLEAGERELQEGQEKYDAAEKELREAREKLDEIAECRWVLLNDRGNAGFVYAEGNSDKLASLSMSFSSIFLVVGTLVIYATISRMVEQQRKLVGTVKAMGLYNREIFAKYLFFACSAVLLGVGLGVFLSWLPVQRIVLRSYEKLFTYGTGTRSFLLRDTGLVVGGALAISIIAVYLGCSQLLRMSAIQLMQEARPGSGRKKSHRSAKRGLYSKLILLNMRTDLARVLVTIVSVAGGCMLMVVGFTLRYGISGVTYKQFGEVLTYEAEIFYNALDNPAAGDEIESILDKNTLPHIRVYKADGVFEAEDTLNGLTMIVAEKGDLEGYFALRSVVGEEKIDLPDSGILVPRRFWEYYGTGIGEPVMIYGTDLNLTEVTIADVFENYFGQLFFTSPTAYEEVFGSAPEKNCFFVKTDGMSLDELQRKVEGIEGLVSVNDAAAQRTMIEQFSASLNFVVLLMLFIAGMMACFIVANFTMTYIQRKTRELTIMRINGFTSGECIRYAAVDLVVTTILGTLLGLALGGVFGQRILSVTETSYIQMIREPVMQSFLFSALVTGGFSIVTNGYALRRVKRLKLSDIS